MGIDKKQVSSLLQMIACSQTDNLDCDGCLEQFPELAEASLSTIEIPNLLKAVERHLEQCPCCRDEFGALLEGLKEVSDRG